MMKSGLSQNEKLKALRIVIDNVDENTLNETLRTVVPFEKQLKDFVDAGIEQPREYRADELMEYISEPISDHVLQEHYTRKTYKWVLIGMEEKSFKGNGC